MSKLYYYCYEPDFLITIALNKNEAMKKFEEMFDDLDFDDDEEYDSVRKLIRLHTKEYKGNVMTIITSDIVTVPFPTVR